MLSTEQRARYHRDGYLVLPGFKSMEEIALLRQRAGEIIDAFDPSESRSIFSTRQQNADAWFLGSDNTIRCFFEEEAFDANGQLRQPKALSINKIGHAMHDLDPCSSASRATRSWLPWPATSAWSSRRFGSRCRTSGGIHLSLLDPNPYHHFGRKRRATATCTPWAVAQLGQLGFALLGGKQIGFHHG
jgi:hypothetical protein